MNLVTPRAAALRILAARASATDPLPSSYSLAQHQVEAVARARSIMQRRGGVLIADGVGLGKTFIAAALVEQELSAGNAVTVVIPAALRVAWRQALRPVIESCPAPLQWLTHGQLSRGVHAPEARLVVVDEAHAFRNPRTQRYRHLWRLCRSGRIALLTATPVNNSLSDLYFQLRLFAADNAFADLGIGSLRALLGAQELDHAALQRLRDDIMIRRTRAQVRVSAGQVELPGGTLRFPGAVHVQTIGYPLLIRPADIRRVLEAITFSAYQDETSRVLVALSLLKRIESSRQAILLSLDRLVGFHRHWLTAFDAGRLLTARSRLPALADEQLIFAELLLPETPVTSDAQRRKNLVDRDLQELIRFRDELARRPDAKQARLLELLTARPPPARTLVFTESRDTAEALWRSLVHLQVGLITGGTAFLGVHSASRAEVIRRFAPVANAHATFKASESVFVLIATDVMSEGLNLQDADAVVSYDLPWNPVRLIQRAGRIDRLGSPHDQVYVYNFLPDHGLDELLGLLRRLRYKLHRLRSAVGQEAEVLEPGESAMADNVIDMPQVVANADDIVVGDFSGAAPPGSMAVMGLSPKRVLVSLGRSGIVRELIVTGHSVVEEDPAAAAHILTRALKYDFPSSCPLEAEAVGLAQAHLAREAANALADAGTGRLRAAVARAVKGQGLLVTPHLLCLADKVLAQLPGYLGPTRKHLGRLASTATIYELESVLQDILVSCSSTNPCYGGGWQLIAALAVD
ncbi:MAG TPA: DEAD/DEAH box helicase [Longimicrobiales bacterium]|nr:DEAD/DEAH box helicase [Longimicrobiales bacterium]